MRKTLNLSLDKSSVQLPDEHADMIVAREFRAGNNSTGKYGEMERLYLACPKCGKQIVKEFISQHTESCQGGDIQDTIGIYNIDYFSITPLTTATFPPQPPRGVLLVLSSCSSCFLFLCFFYVISLSPSIRTTPVRGSPFQFKR